MIGVPDPALPKHTALPGGRFPPDSTPAPLRALKPLTVAGKEAFKKRKRRE